MIDSLPIRWSEREKSVVGDAARNRPRLLLLNPGWVAAPCLTALIRHSRVVWELPYDGGRSSPAFSGEQR